MANEGYHEPTTELSDETRDMHRAILSLMEELEAVDWLSVFSAFGIKVGYVSSSWGLWSRSVDPFTPGSPAFRLIALPTCGNEVGNL
jgi:hypothetical protein